MCSRVQLCFIYIYIYIIILYYIYIYADIKNLENQYISISISNRTKNVVYAKVLEYQKIKGEKYCSRLPDLKLQQIFCY